MYIYSISKGNKNAEMTHSNLGCGSSYYSYSIINYYEYMLKVVDTRYTRRVETDKRYCMLAVYHYIYYYYYSWGIEMCL